MQDTSFEVCPQCGATFVLPVYRCKHCENDAAQKLNTAQSTRESSIPVLNAAYVSEAPNRAPSSFWALRKIGLFLLLGGAAMLAINVFSLFTQGAVYPMAAALGPIMMSVGIGGLIDPRLYLAITKDGRDLPFRFKFIGTGFGLAGLAVSLYLTFSIYHIFGG